MTTPLLPAHQWETHRTIAREAVRVPINAATIGPLAVALGGSLAILARDLLLQVIDRDLAGARTDRDAREA